MVRHNLPFATLVLARAQHFMTHYLFHTGTSAQTHFVCTVYVHSRIIIFLCGIWVRCFIYMWVVRSLHSPFAIIRLFPAHTPQHKPCSPVCAFSSYIVVVHKLALHEQIMNECRCWCCCCIPIFTFAFFCYPLSSVCDSHNSDFTVQRTADKLKISEFDFCWLLGAGFISISSPPRLDSSQSRAQWINRRVVGFFIERDIFDRTFYFPSIDEVCQFSLNWLTLSSVSKGGHFHTWRNTCSRWMQEMSAREIRTKDLVEKRHPCCRSVKNNLSGRNTHSFIMIRNEKSVRQKCHQRTDMNRAVTIEICFPFVSSNLGFTFTLNELRQNRNASYHFSSRLSDGGRGMIIPQK